MTARGPRVRDFTETGRGLRVRVEAGEIFEVLVAVYAYIERACWDLEFDDPKFFERIDEHAPQHLRDELVAFETGWDVWLRLVGYAADSKRLRSVDAFATMLSEEDPLALRRRLLTNNGTAAVRHGEELIAAAVAGDAEAIDEVAPKKAKALRRVLAMDPAESVSLLIEVIETFRSALRDELQAVVPLLERDAAAKRAMARTMPADRLVETATKGVTFDMHPTVSGILLVPSFVVHPWTVLAENGSERIFFYSLDEDELNADPSAPPGHLVEIYRALGDERRLQILGLLAEGDTDLRSLADHFDLAKSTVHHHVRTLRRAGLVRVVVGDDESRYSLRKEGLDEAGPLLESYLMSRRAGPPTEKPLPPPTEDR